MKDFANLIDHATPDRVAAPERLGELPVGDLRLPPEVAGRVLARNNKGKTGGGGTEAPTSPATAPPETPKRYIDGFTTPGGESELEVLEQLGYAVQDWTGKEAKDGVWAYLVVFDGKLHVFDGDRKPFGVFGLRAKARIPVNGSYVSFLKPPSEKSAEAPAAPAVSRWESFRHGFDQNGNTGWVPWTWGSKAKPGDIMLEEWIVDDDRSRFFEVTAITTRIALAVTGHKGVNVAEARKRVKGVNDKIAKAKEAKAKKGAGKGDKSEADELPDAVKLIEGALDVFLRILKGSYKEDIAYKEGESELSLLDRLKRAVEKIKDETNLERGGAIVKNAATQTGFDERPGKGKPGKLQNQGKGGGNEIPLDAATIAALAKDGGRSVNTPAYPAEIISYGQIGNEEAQRRAQDGSGPRRAPTPKDKKITERTVTGATLEFAMNLYYGMSSVDWRDETYNRMQPVAYKWELIDVSNLDLKALAERVDSNAAGAESTDPDSGLRRNIARDFANTWDDTKADLDPLDRNNLMLSNPVTGLGWLGVVAISDVVQLGGTLIKNYFSLISRPLNMQSIGFSKEGLFLLRCFAQPIVTDEMIERVERLSKKLGRELTPVIRAPSVDVLPVRVMSSEKRAEDAQKADLEEIDRLKAQKLEPSIWYTPEEIQSQIDERTVGLGRNLPETVKRQVEVAEEEIKRIDRWKAWVTKGTKLEERATDDRIWHARLDAQGVDFAKYEKSIRDSKVKLEKEYKRVATGWGVKNLKTRPVRPKMAFVSELNGNVYTIQANLAEAASGSREGSRVWRLIDLTSAATQYDYEGTGKTHTEAIIKAIEAFCGEIPYGVGFLSVQLPLSQVKAIADQEDVFLPNGGRFRCRPGREARALKRLQDLATAAELAALVISGPIGVAIGTAGAVAGGIVAATSLTKKASSERLGQDLFATGMDIIGVLGAFVAVGGLASPKIAAELRGASEAKWASANTVKDAQHAARLAKYADRVEAVGQYLHIAGTGFLKAQVIIVPVTFVHELVKIDKEEKEDPNPDPGKYRARRLEAFATALKGGIVTVRSMQMAKDPTAGWDPLQKPSKPPAPAPEIKPRPTPESHKPPAPHDPALGPKPPPGPTDPLPLPGKGEKPPVPPESTTPHAPKPPPDPLGPDTLGGKILERGKLRHGEAELLVREVSDWRGALKAFVERLPAGERARAQRQLEGARATLLREEIMRIAEKHGVEAFDVGSKGFKSDIDVTLVPKKGDKRSPSDQIRAAAEAADALAKALRERLGGDPERVADIAVHAYIGEKTNVFQTTKQKQVGTWMQGELSFAELRRSMTQEQWATYKERLYLEAQQSGRVQEMRDLRTMVEQGERFHGRMKAELAAATKDAPPALSAADRAVAARDTLLLSKRRQLADLFAAQPPDATAIQRLQAEIRYLAPGAYFTEAAYQQAVAYGQARGKLNPEEFSISWATERGIPAAERRARLAAVAEANYGMYSKHAGEGAPLDAAKDAAKYSGRMLEALQLMGTGDTSAVALAVERFRAGKLGKEKVAIQQALETYRSAMKLDPSMPLPEVAARFTEHAKQWMADAAIRARMLERTAEGAVKPVKTEPKTKWDHEFDKAFDEATTPQVKGGKEPTIDGKRVPTEQQPRLDIQDIARRPGETMREAAERVTRILGADVATYPEVRACWDDAVAAVTKGKQLTEATYPELYKAAQKAFWLRVRKHPVARAYFTDAGFSFPPSKANNTAPVLEHTRADVPVTEARVSLDHKTEKAQPGGWQKALDADNLRFEMQMPNTFREIIQARHPELRPGNNPPQPPPATTPPQEVKESKEPVPVP